MARHPGGCRPEPGQTDPADLRPESMRPNGPPFAPNRQGSGVAGHRESTGLHVTLCGRLAAICRTISADLRVAPDRGVGRLTVREWVICVLMRIPDPARLRPVLGAAGLVAEGEDRSFHAPFQAYFREASPDPRPHA